MLVRWFTMYNMSVLHKQGVPKLKENYARVIHGPIKCIKRVM